MDPHTGGYLFHSSAADACFGAAIELTHAHGLPSLGSANGTDVHAPGWQSAKEGHAGFISALVGAEMVFGMRGMASASVTYPEYLILDCDQFHDDQVVAGGIQVDHETLALDTIAEVGPRGNYLTEPHTTEHIRKIPISEVIMETKKMGLEDSGGVIETARQKAKWIFENHTPEPLDEKTQLELERILATADQEIKDT